MNSEELEISLKAEFESHLSDVFESFRQRSADLEKSFENEIAKHKSQMDEAIRLLRDSLETRPALDEALQQSIAEHLRLAKDSGAELAATAFGEAEKLRVTTDVPVSYDKLRDAIKEISSKTSQSTILTSLVTHASEFAPRGVFFILKNDNFVCWKRFGRDTASAESSPDVRFPASDVSILSRSIETLSTVEGQFTDGCGETSFVNELLLGRPDRMYAIPLTARGRGVAVLYVDYGTDGTSMNIEALESLVRVAGLTVELLAAAHVSQVQSLGQNISSDRNDRKAAPISGDPNGDAGAREFTSDSDPYSPAYAGGFRSPVSVQEVVKPAYNSTFDTDATTAADMGVSYEPVAETAVSNDLEPEYEIVDESVDAGFGYNPGQHVELNPTMENLSSSIDLSEISTPEAHDQFEVERSGHDSTETVTDFAFASNDDQVSSDTSAPEMPNFEATEIVAEPVPEPMPEPMPEPFVAEPMPEPFVAEPMPVPETVMVPEVSKPRYSGRNMDLPIEVPEDERRVHNEARRFARLLVSEIKLYNEQKVAEGVEACDLYDRLREAIDRSREMYEKRVKPVVASKFDYFHYELVNDLADGDVNKLGSNYSAPQVN